MATIAPLLPGLPDLAPLRKGRRRCAPRLTHGWTLKVVLPQVPDPGLYDFLMLWYAHVRACGEHAGLWGEAGLWPSRFVGTFATLPLVLLHHDRMPWTHADGLMMVVWLDDIVDGVRARLHQWVGMPYRHPRVSTALGHFLLRYIFEEMGFQLVEGRTPIGNRLALWYARRLGFRPVVTLPYGEWAWTADGTKTLTPVVQSMLLAEDWHRAQEASGGNVVF